MPADPMTDEQLEAIEARAGTLASYADVPALVAEVRRLRKTLSWYGDRGNYEREYTCHPKRGFEETKSAAERDGGWKARAALPPAKKPGGG